MKSSKMELGKLTLQQLKELFAQQHQLQQHTNNLSELSVEYADNIVELFQHGPAWSLWYELPYDQFLVLMLTGFGLLELFVEAAKQPNPLQATLDLVEETEQPSDADIDELSPDERGYMMSLFLALQGNITAQRIYNKKMNDMVQQASVDDEALFNAVLVDRGSLSSPTIVKRIQLAAVQKDEGFFNRLSKAVTKTRSRPKAEYDDFRFMLDILETFKPLSQLSTKELFEIFVDELELYPFFGDQDSYEAFRKFLNRWRKR